MCLHLKVPAVECVRKKEEKKKKEKKERINERKREKKRKEKKVIKSKCRAYIRHDQL